MLKYVFLGLAGALSVAAYAPLEFWWIMPVCLATLYYYWSNTVKPFQAFKLGLVFGLCQFGLGVSWIYVSLHTFGNMPPIMAGFAVFLFVLTLAVFYAVIGYSFVYLSNNWRSNTIVKAVLFASLWILADWSRTFVLTGFPWLDVGYTQTTQLLSAYAPIGGVYLVSFMLLLIAALATSLLNSLKSAIISFAVIISVIVSAVALNYIEWTKDDGEEISVALVQANIPIEQKWQSSYRGALMQNYLNLLPKSPVDLVVFSETALPFYLNDTSPELWNSLSENAGSIIAGVMEFDPLNGDLYNSAVMTCGEQQQIYRKQHLVPFGEYLPFRNMLSWVLDYLQIPMSDFSSGEESSTLECDGLKIALSICYEDAFADEIRSNLGDGQLLVNISEDAWFGNSLAPHQRRQMAQMRAQELSRPMVRGSNSGPSNLIDANGDVILSSKQFSQQTLIGKVQPKAGRTPFLNYGLWFVYLSGVLVLIVFVDRFVRTKSIV